MNDLTIDTDGRPTAAFTDVQNTRRVILTPRVRTGNPNARPSETFYFNDGEDSVEVEKLEGKLVRVVARGRGVIEST